MHRSNAFLHDSCARTDKLSLLKYVLCATSQVVVGEHGDKVYHPMRSPDFVLLEAIIFFFRSLFARHRCNVRMFSRMFCHFQIVSIVRWHISGFPLIMTQNRQTQDLRKALRVSMWLRTRILANSCYIVHVGKHAFFVDVGKSKGKWRIYDQRGPHSKKDLKTMCTKGGYGRKLVTRVLKIAECV